VASRIKFGDGSNVTLFDNDCPALHYLLGKDQTRIAKQQALAKRFSHEFIKAGINEYANEMR
jgi:hypothetical protein